MSVTHAVVSLVTYGTMLPPLRLELGACPIGAQLRLRTAAAGDTCSASVNAEPDGAVLQRVGEVVYQPASTADGRNRRRLRRRDKAPAAWQPRPPAAAAVAMLARSCNQSAREGKRRNIHLERSALDHSTPYPHAPITAPTTIPTPQALVPTIHIAWVSLFGESPYKCSSRFNCTFLGFWRYAVRSKGYVAVS